MTSEVYNKYNGIRMYKRKKEEKRKREEELCVSFAPVHPYIYFGAMADESFFLSFGVVGRED